MAYCNVCFRHCNIPEGKTGFCGARTCQDGIVTADNYGLVTSLALDPIEKKPLTRFMPGSIILSAGSYGCNLRCPFCQNSDISWSEEALKLRNRTEYISPEDLAYTAEYYSKDGNIGVAFTYNEPLVGWEYIRDTAKLVHDRGMKNVLVTNGTASEEILLEIIPHIDAMNIDLKGFTDRYYSDVLGGSREMTMRFIETAVKHCHVELTCLIVPGENDSESEIAEMSRWIASLETGREEGGRCVPLHISRFFPRFHMTDRGQTPVSTVYRLAEKAREHLRYVYTGNC